MARIKKQPLSDLPLFKKLNEALNSNEKTDDFQIMKFALKKQTMKSPWKGLVATPPSSFLEKIIHVFYTKTDIPLEIPFFTALSHLSAYLLKEDVVINLNGQKILPDIWTIVLASSGSGKSFASGAISKYINADSYFPDSSSSAMFVQNLLNNNKGFLFRDEFGQFLKSIDNQPHMAEMKDLLLKVYDNATIERNTKKEQFKIENAALVILGVTVLETFISQIGVEALLDGFAQRFQLVIAEKDPSRKMEDFALYDVFTDEIKNSINSEWEILKQSVKHKEYNISKEAINGFKTSFKLQSTLDIPESFYRRIMFKGIKYALLYHILLKKTDDVIDSEDMGYAGRLCAVHLADAAKLLDGTDKTEIQLTLRSVETAVKEMEENGIEVNARNLIRKVNRIKTASEAKVFLSMIK